MNTTNIVTVRPADVFPDVQSSTQERLTHRVNNETISKRAFIAATVAMASFLSYVCYYALQNYGVL